MVQLSPANNLAHFSEIHNENWILTCQEQSKKFSKVRKRFLADPEYFSASTQHQNSLVSLPTMAADRLSTVFPLYHTESNL